MQRRTFLKSILNASLAALAFPYVKSSGGLIVPRGTWQRATGVITACYQFGEAGQVTVKVLHDGAEYNSLMDAARAIAAERGITPGLVQKKMTMLPGEDPLTMIDVKVVYEDKGQCSATVREALFTEMPWAEIEKNSAFTETAKWEKA